RLADEGEEGAADSKEFVHELTTIPGGGLQFPFLTNPASVFGLLLGKDAVLFTYDLPTLVVNFSFSPFFPIIYPLGVKAGGSLGAIAPLPFGYDTAGLREFFDKGNAKAYHDPTVLFDGFYISDRKNPDGTGEDVPEVTLLGGLDADLELNVAIAEAGVGG